MKRFLTPFIMAVLLSLSFFSCQDLVPIFAPPDFVPWTPSGPPVEPLQDSACQQYFPIDSPAFCQGYIEFDNPLTDYWIINVGSSGQDAPFQDSIFPGEEGTISQTLASMLEAFLPQYTHQGWQRPDALRIACIMDGTNETSQLQHLVWFRADGAKWFMTFARRGLLFGGAITNTDTLLALHEKYKSCERFNLRDAGQDSISETRINRKTLHHDLCKAGEEWADFRFNNYPPTDSMLQAYEDAGWQKVLSSVSPGWPIEVRGRRIGKFKSETLADTRGYCATDDEIITLLNLGFVVIADE